jgi:RNA polymerase sigma-70 factor (ECF subfamily)
MTSLVSELMDLYEPVARACCRSYRLREDEVEDVVHDTFLAAYRNLPKYDAQIKLSSLLWTIARRQIISRLRKQAKRRCRAGVQHYPESPASVQDPAQLARLRELGRELQARVAALPEPWMTAVRLFCWHHKSAHEIAMQMRIKQGTIQVILHRSRRRLRCELEDLYAA